MMGTRLTRARSTGAGVADTATLIYLAGIGARIGPGSRSNMRLNSPLFWKGAAMVELGPRGSRQGVCHGKADGHLKNRLLASMSASDYSLIESSLLSETYEQGAVVQEAGEVIEKIYFPQNGMISLLVVTQDGGGIEAATIGYEGAVGVNRGLGRRRAFTRAVVQLAGTFSHISAEAFEDATLQSANIKDIITKYTEVLWVEAQQIAACNAVHDAEARLARWLLQTQDRIQPETTTIELTQDFLSQMLGIRRTTVTLVARALQTAGLIRYRRGRIEIIDRPALEEAACECYTIIRHETLPDVIGVDLKPR
jgi:CRP-like cAMP-binding protein